MRIKDIIIENTEPTDDQLFSNDLYRRQQLAKRLQQRLGELEGTMEPEDAYDQVADEMNMDLEDLFDILEDDTLYEADAESDDELFGNSTQRVLPAGHCAALAKAMLDIRMHWEKQPETRDMSHSDPDDFAAVYRDFNRAIMAFRKGDVISAVAALQNAPMGFDLDEWAMHVLKRKTGIDLWRVIDMDNDEIERAYDKARNDMAQPHTRFDGIIHEEESDDELFGTNGPAAQRIIYTYGKKMLTKLEHAFELGFEGDYNDIARDEDGDVMPDIDSDAMFNLVLKITGAQFGKAFVVDTILREYAGMEGLNDFGWMIEGGQFHDLVDAWDEFGRDTGVGHEDWFKKEMQDFMGDR